MVRRMRLATDLAPPRLHPPAQAAAGMGAAEVNRITVVTGPPCSGKSTYVQQHRMPGDIIVDFDLIAQALGSSADHDHPDALREIAAAAWWISVRRILENRPAPAWIIDAKPKPRHIADYDKAGVRWVRLNASREELRKRAGQQGRSAASRRRIDEWFESSDPKPTSAISW